LRDELVNYLHFVSTGLPHPINIPAVPMYADEYICGEELWVGDMPKIGGNFICCVSLEGFPFHSYPNILEILEHLPIAYRWSNRMTMLDQHESVGELKKKRRKWRQKQRGFLAQIFKVNGGMVNEDAIAMGKETEAAINESNAGLVAFGYYTSVVVLMGPDKKELYENARFLVREVQREGFACRIETINTLEAWLGTLPGHTYPNVRRSLIHTLNLADILPLSTVWPGQETCPSPFYPDNSPALLYGATSGSTPFRLNLHVGDVGHTLVFGPTGAGKSTLLATIIAQFRRYPNASIFAFDKGNSLWAIANAAGGRHYDIASDATPNFAPLSVLESDSDMMWAEEWIANCYELQTGQRPTPTQRQEIHRAMILQRDASTSEFRSLSEFTTTVQDKELRDALNYYTVSGSLGHLLDSHRDGLQHDSFTVLELEELMALGDKAAIPVLLYLFRRFEKSLHGQPSLLVLDEAWIMLGHSVFREKIREWLKVLRKANCAVVLATQSLSDAVKSGIFDVLIESCPTKILLPNEEANKGGTEHHPGPKDLYTVMGLNEAQIHILETAMKKRHYYYLSPEGRRLFDLGLGPIALSFVAVSDKTTLAHLKQLKAIKGDQWPYEWLKERRVNYEALMS
jgi:type IV secretion system protein TrbE